MIYVPQISKYQNTAKLFTHLSILISNMYLPNPSASEKYDTRSIAMQGSAG